MTCKIYAFKDSMENHIRRQCNLKYSGMSIDVILTEEAKKREAERIKLYDEAWAAMKDE